MKRDDNFALEKAIDDAVRFLPLRDSSHNGCQYAKEEVRRILRLVPGMKALDEHPRVQHERLDRLVGHIARLQRELSELTYPDRVFWRLHSRNMGERMRNPNLPLTDELLHSLKTHLAHLEKLACAEAEMEPGPFAGRKAWTYRLAFECHTAFVYLCDARPTTSHDSAFTNFVRKVHECAERKAGKTLHEERGKTLHEEIRTAISSIARKVGKIPRKNR